MASTAPSKRLSAKRAEEREAAKQREARRRKLTYVLVAVGLLVVAALIALLTTQESGSAIGVDDVAGSPEVLGELPLASRDGSEDPVVDTPAPQVQGADFDGNAVSIGEPGSPELLLFMASWCPACQEELPEVVSWMEAGGLPDDVELTAVVTGLDDARPNWPPDAWLEEENFAGQVLVDDADGSVAAAYGMPATPYWVVLDEDGRIVARVTGMMNQEQMSAMADAALAGQG